jgi:hypothetical protein
MWLIEQKLGPCREQERNTEIFLIMAPYLILVLLFFKIY